MSALLTASELSPVGNSKPSEYYHQGSGEITFTS